MDREKAIEFAGRIGLPMEWEESGGRLVLSIEDSDGYARAYSRLDKSDCVKLDPDAVSMADEDSVLRYVGGGFAIEIHADFDKDSYYATIEEEGDERD